MNNYLIRVYRDIAIEASSEEEARSKILAMVTMPNFIIDIKESIEAEEVDLND